MGVKEFENKDNKILKDSHDIVSLADSERLKSITLRSLRDFSKIKDREKWSVVESIVNYAPEMSAQVVEKITTSPSKQMTKLIKQRAYAKDMQEYTKCHSPLELGACLSMPAVFATAAAFALGGVVWGAVATVASVSIVGAVVNDFKSNPSEDKKSMKIANILSNHYARKAEKSERKILASVEKELSDALYCAQM